MLKTELYIYAEDMLELYSKDIALLSPGPGHQLGLPVQLSLNIFF